jgi:hypothetical protein
MYLPEPAAILSHLARQLLTMLLLATLWMASTYL